MSAAPTRKRPSLIDVNAVADRLGTTPRHIRNLVYRRAIPFIKVGRALRFDPERIDTWLADNSEDGAA